MWYTVGQNYKIQKKNIKDTSKLQIAGDGNKITKLCHVFYFYYIYIIYIILVVISDPWHTECSNLTKAR